MKPLSIGAMLSSDKMDWATPQALFDALDREFGFTVDGCAIEKHPAKIGEGVVFSLTDAVNISAFP